MPLLLLSFCFSVGSLWQNLTYHFVPKLFLKLHLHFRFSYPNHEDWNSSLQLFDLQVSVVVSVSILCPLIFLFFNLILLFSFHVHFSTFSLHCFSRLQFLIFSSILSEVNSIHSFKVLSFLLPQVLYPLISSFFFKWKIHQE